MPVRPTREYTRTFVTASLASPAWFRQDSRGTRKKAEKGTLSLAAGQRVTKKCEKSRTESINKMKKIKAKMKNSVHLVLADVVLVSLYFLWPWKLVLFFFFLPCFPPVSVSSGQRPIPNKQSTLKLGACALNAPASVPAIRKTGCHKQAVYSVPRRLVEQKKFATRGQSRCWGKGS